MLNHEVINYLKVMYGADLNNIEKQITEEYNLQEDLKYLNIISTIVEKRLCKTLIDVLIRVEVIEHNPFSIKNMFKLLEYESDDKELKEKQKDFKERLKTLSEDKIESFDVTRVLNDYREMINKARKLILNIDKMTMLECEMYRRNKYIFILEDGRKICLNKDNILFEQLRDGYHTMNKWLGVLEEGDFKELKEKIDLKECRFAFKIS